MVFREADALLKLLGGSILLEGDLLVAISNQREIARPVSRLEKARGETLTLKSMPG